MKIEYNLWWQRCVLGFMWTDREAFQFAGGYMPARFTLYIFLGPVEVNVIVTYHGKPRLIDALR